MTPPNALRGRALPLLLALALTVLTLLSSPAQAQTPPAAPSAVTITRADGVVRADWEDVTGATHYHITYSTNNKQSWHLGGTNYPTSEFTINAAYNSKFYIVAVRAGNDDGWSGWTDSASIAPFLVPPSQVTLTRCHNVVTADWDAVTGATLYHINYSVNNGGTWHVVHQAHYGTGITLTGANNGSTYIMSVRAYNDDSSSSWTNSAPGRSAHGA